MKKTVTLIIALVISAVAFAQEDNYDKLVEKCIKSNGTYAYYENVVDQMFTMLEKQYASQEVPVTVWNELKRLKEPSLDDLANSPNVSIIPSRLSSIRKLISHEIKRLFLAPVPAVKLIGVAKFICLVESISYINLSVV